jgi:zinc/manganese transport system substrate-binding protein
MRSWIKSIGAALVVAFMAAGLYTLYINWTNSGNPLNPTPTLTREGEMGKIKVVTSTNVWASVVEIVGGEWVEVTAIIDDPMQDPHSYEASARDQLAVSEADLVIANGGGYDDFLTQLVEASEGERIFLKLVEGEHIHAGEAGTGDAHAEEGHGEEHGHDHEHGNEHIWYELEMVAKAADMIRESIVELRPESASAITEKYDFFIAELANLEIRIEAVRERIQGTGFLATEGVGNLLLEDAGFVNQTPEALADAVEEETEVPASALKRAQDLLRNGIVSLMVVNQQVSDQVSEQLETLAVSEGVPVLKLSELITEPNQDYLDWMASILDQLQEAVY